MAFPFLGRGWLKIFTAKTQRTQRFRYLLFAIRYSPFAIFKRVTHSLNGWNGFQRIFLSVPSVESVERNKGFNLDGSLPAP